MSISLSEINAMPAGELVRRFGPLFEHSPWIAERAAARRPFSSLETFYDTLTSTLDAASDGEKLALIGAHPDLAGRLAIAGQLTADSTSEQRSARLDRLTPEQFARMTALNERYRARFGFPFVICVKDHTQETIFTEFERRVNLDQAGETTAALDNIKRIAWHRLQALLAS